MASLCHCLFVSSFTSSSSSSEALANVKEDMSNSDDSEILAAHGLNTRGGAAVCVEDVRQTEANCKKMLAVFLQKTAGCQTSGGLKVGTPEVTFWTS